jgi:hypothetical protein
MNSRADFLRQAQRKYVDFLRSTVDGESMFPMVLMLGKTARADTYEARRAELSQFRKDAADLGLEVVWETVEERRFGRHERPTQARFAEEASYLRALGKAQEAAHFRAECAMILARSPEWKPWVADHVPAVLRELGNWERLLGVVAWLKENPHSGLYLRQLPIIGVDTKFIESRAALIDQLLAFPDPPVGGTDFRARWGLRSEEALVRLRFLDPALRSRCGFPECADEVALPVSRAAMLPLHGALVLMAENLRNFLALPPIPGGVALFGSGDALAHWRHVDWLPATTCHYWGDIDAHGFALLARLRQFLPHAHSLLMDQTTLGRHRALAVRDDTRPPAFDSSLLQANEAEAYGEVSRHRIRLEQERLPMETVHQEIERLRGAFVAAAGLGTVPS